MYEEAEASEALGVQPRDGLARSPHPARELADGHALRASLDHLALFGRQSL